MRTAQGRALFGGVAAHPFRPLHYPMTSAIGLGILTAGHRHGWPVAEGGSASITTALAAMLTDLGGKIETGVPIRAASQLPPADATLFDLAPESVAAILADRLPPRIQRAYSRFRRGPGAFKVDFTVEGGVPWTNPHARRAGTVHLGGSFAERAAAERDVHAGRMPQRPFVLIGQQYLADPQRSVGDIDPVWSYAHVPNGYTGDATAAIIAQIERFAPGFRDRIVGQAARTTTDMPAYSPNFACGDIMIGPPASLSGRRRSSPRSGCLAAAAVVGKQRVPSPFGHRHPLLGHPVPAEDSAPLTIGLPDRLGPDPDEVSTFHAHETRRGWVPLYPETSGVPTTGSHCPVAACRPFQRPGPITHVFVPSSRVRNNEASSGVHSRSPARPSPRPVAPPDGRGALRLLPWASHPNGQTRRRTPGRGSILNTDRELAPRRTGLQSAGSFALHDLVSHENFPYWYPGRVLSSEPRRRCP